MNPQEKALLHQFNINIANLTKDFGSQSIDRGVRYYRNNQVLSIDEVYENDLGGLSVQGRTRGSGKNIYSTYVDLLPHKGQYFAVSSECSCPVDRNCKHGIAVLFHTLANVMEEQLLEEGTLVDHTTAQRMLEEEKVNEWLSALPANDQMAGLSKLSNETQQQSPLFYLVYALDIISNQKGEQVKVSPHKVRLLKKGGYGKAMNFNIYDLTEEYRSYNLSNCYFEAIDKEIARLLLSSETESYYGSANSNYYLSGDLGDLVLKKMLATERCFWKTQEQNSPLTLGKACEMKLTWEEDKDHLRVKPTLNCSSSRLLKLGQLYYLDEGRNQCGVVRCSNLSAEQAISFINAPPIPKQNAKAVSEQLLRLFPDKEVPLPENIEVENIDIKDVIPDVHLRMHSEGIPGGQRLHMASLSFDYEGALIQSHTNHDLDQDSTVLIEGNKRYRITRDTETEANAFTVMSAAGFDSLDSRKSPYGVSDMVIYGDLNVEESVEKWGHFMNVLLPDLRDDGWQVNIEDNFYLQVSTANDWLAELETDEAGEWFELSLGFELGGKRVNLLPVLVDLLAGSSDTHSLREKLKDKEHQLLKIDDFQWVKIPTRRLLRVLDILIELYDKDALNQYGNFEFSRHEGLHYGDLLNDAGLQWKGAEELKALQERLQQFEGIKTAPLPKGLKAELRDYQQQGYDWMSFMRDFKFNGVLADDMGLGKTIQALCMLLAEKEKGHAKCPSLVIAPTSLMSNWQNEAARFTPDLEVLVLQGSDRKAKFELIEKADLVITTYPLIVRDAEIYQDQSFHYLVLDEAQAIKNPRAKSSLMIAKLKSQHRLCLTGTPVENHLGELWSMFHILMPGYLGTMERFNRLFRHPVEKHGDVERSKQLQKRVQPFMLRRTKDQVASELPEKTEIIRTVSLSGKQRDLYETVRLAMDKKLRDEIKKKGLARSHIMILDALLKLRQVCCDPRLVKLDKAKKIKESAKLTLLMELLPEMVENSNKILLFSQFTSMLSLIEAELKKHKISYSKLTGQTRKRAEAISAFQEGDAAVFLISLKAGGTGLNLTAADTVIHYDPWWNPAVEQQATDRAYRIGQDKPVFVYKLLTEDTVEEKIQALQQKKQALADSIYGGEAQGKQGGAFEQADLMELLQPLK